MLLAEIKIVIPNTPAKFSFKEFSGQVRPLAQNRFAQVFGGDVAVEVFVGAGSIISVLKIVGILTGIAAGASTVLANYGHDRENIPVIYNDIRQAAHWISVEMQDRAGGFPQRGTTVEIDAHVPMRLFVIGRAMNELSSDMLRGAISPSDAGEKATQISDQLMKLRELSPSEGDVEVIQEALKSRTELLRQIANEDPNYRNVSIYPVLERALLELLLPEHPRRSRRNPPVL